MMRSKLLGVLIHIWCVNFLKKAEDFGRSSVDVRCCMSNMSRAKVYVKNEGKIPISIISEDGCRSFRVRLYSLKVLENVGQRRGNEEGRGGRNRKEEGGR